MSLVYDIIPFILVSFQANKNNMSSKRSVVWKHFVVCSETTAQCSICKDTFQYHGSTSSLRYHLFSKHHVQEENCRKLTTYGFPCVNNQARITLDKKALWFIIKDIRPLNSIEKDGFMQFSKNLNPSYEPPNRKRIRSMLDEEYENGKNRVYIK